jgi:hypothetical protein
MVHEKWVVLKPEKTKILKPDSNFKIINFQNFVYG